MSTGLLDGIHRTRRGTGRTGQRGGAMHDEARRERQNNPAAAERSEEMDFGVARWFKHVNPSLILGTGWNRCKARTGEVVLWPPHVHHGMHALPDTVINKCSLKDKLLGWVHAMDYRNLYRHWFMGIRVWEKESENPAGV